MSAYLQRLYDAAGATSAAVDARPAQRSSSPLLAVDQRLATTAYATSFLLGLPGGPEPQPGPEPEPEGLAVPRPLRREAVVRDETLVRVVPPRPVPPKTPEPDTEERVDPRSRPDVDPEASTNPSPPVEPRPHLADVPPVAHAQPPPAEQDRPTRTSGPGPETVQPLPLVREAADPAPVRARPERLAEPPVTSRPDSGPAAPEVAAAPAAVTPRRAPAAVPVLLHPAPAPAAEQLPPPAAPRAADLAAQVRRLVREEMSADTPSARPTREREPGSAAETSAPATRPSTAEAMSVIGPLERSAPSTTLYGLRLR
ncbi:MAG: hypothetical protein JJD92_00995 [Frankiaceae bacterium]|nr:hypothetical protein [Frankiaceae bacterium]